MTKTEFKKLIIGDKVSKWDFFDWKNGEIKDIVFNHAGELIGVYIKTSSKNYNIFCHIEDCITLYRNEEKSLWNEANIKNKEFIKKQVKKLIDKEFETWKKTKLENCLNVRLMMDLLKTGKLNVRFNVEVVGKP